MQNAGNPVLDTLGGLSLRGTTHGSAGWIALGKPTPTTVTMSLTQVTEIGSDYLILNPDDDSPDIPSPGLDKGVSIQWKGKRLKYSYHPNQFGAIQNVEIHSDMSAQEKHFSCVNIPINTADSSHWVPVLLHSGDKYMAVYNGRQWPGSGLNGINPPTTPTGNHAAGALLLATFKPNYNMLNKNFFVQASGDGSTATDYRFNLMEYDINVHGGSGRVSLNNGTSLSGHLNVLAANNDHAVQSNMASNILLTKGKAYVLWANYPTQSTFQPSKKPSVKWYFEYTRNA